MSGRPLRFHWSLSQAGDNRRTARDRSEMPGLLNLDAQLRVCRQAERYGIESMLMAIGFTRPDPTLLSVALGRQTESVKFMIACRSGLISPTYFVQQVNSASTLIDGRICLNMVCGHSPDELRYYGDFLNHDERYRRTDEFLSVCHGLWNSEEVNFRGDFYRIEGGRIRTPFCSANGRRGPEIYIGGNSKAAAGLAVKHASCLWRFPDPPDRIAESVGPVLAAGTEVGLLASIISRPARGQALAAAEALIADLGSEQKQRQERYAAISDSVGFQTTHRRSRDFDPWLTDTLWTGAVPYMGPPSIALVGSHREVAEAILDYKKVGISQFLFLGWNVDEDLRNFGEGVLPLVRERESDRASTGAK